MRISHNKTIFEVNVLNTICLADEYINELKNYKNTYNFVYCMRVFSSCIGYAVPGSDLSALKPDLFKYFFSEYLPYYICQEDDDIIESFYPCLRAFCKNIDFSTGADTMSALNTVSAFAKGESRRIMYVKKNIMNFIKSPVMLKKPAVIDIERYRLKAEKQKNRKADYIPEEGYFKVADIFTNNSVVLKKISGYTFFIRVYLDAKTIDTIRPGDILDIKVRRLSKLGGWAIEDIDGCFARDSI